MLGLKLNHVSNRGQWPTACKWYANEYIWVPMRNVSTRNGMTFSLKIENGDTISLHSPHKNLHRRQIIIHEVYVFDLNRTDFSMETRETS